MPNQLNDVLEKSWKSKPNSTGWVPSLDIKVHIVCAANMYTLNTGEQIIFCGARHFSPCMRSALKFSGLEKAMKEEQGFIDQFSRYWSRKEAWDIVILEGQVMSDRYPSTNGSQELFSEDLY